MTKLSKLMDELHMELAQELLDKVRSGEAKASELNVARQFLKDNGVEGLPVDNSPFKELVDELPFNEENKSYGGTI
tara:strand:+ start:93 stop:320 length:228 start_codon:yes stop_codon:yes gene_type:complete